MPARCLQCIEECEDRLSEDRVAELLELVRNHLH